MIYLSELRAGNTSELTKINLIENAASTQSLNNGFEKEMKTEP